MIDMFPPQPGRSPGSAQLARYFLSHYYYQHSIAGCPCCQVWKPVAGTRAGAGVSGSACAAGGGTGDKEIGASAGGALSPVVAFGVNNAGAGAQGAAADGGSGAGSSRSSKQMVDLEQVDDRSLEIQTRSSA